MTIVMTGHDLMLVYDTEGGLGSQEERYWVVAPNGESATYDNARYFGAIAQRYSLTRVQQEWLRQTNLRIRAILSDMCGRVA